MAAQQPPFALLFLSPRSHSHTAWASVVILLLLVRAARRPSGLASFIRVASLQTAIEPSRVHIVLLLSQRAPTPAREHRACR